MLFFLFLLFLRFNLFSDVFSFGEKSLSFNVSYNNIPFSIDIEGTSIVFYNTTYSTVVFKNKVNLKGNSRYFDYSAGYNFSYIDWIFSFKGIFPHRENVYYNDIILIDEKVYGIGLGISKILEGDGNIFPQISFSSFFDFLNSDDYRKFILTLNFGMYKKVKNIPFFLSFSYPTVFYFIREEEWYKGDVSFFVFEAGFKILKKDFSLSLSSGFGIDNNIFKFSFSKFL